MVQRFYVPALQKTLVEVCCKVQESDQLAHAMERRFLDEAKAGLCSKGFSRAYTPIDEVFSARIQSTTKQSHARPFDRFRCILAGLSMNGL